jgi:hypothetical protein
VLAGLFVAPTQSASALGCVLGPSLASAAKAAGVSCPDVEGGSGGGAAWGAMGGACAYGWRNGQLPDGMLDYLNSSTSWTNDYTTDKGARISRTTYVKGGRTIGQIQIHSYHGEFLMGISIYGRAGFKQEFGYFDCMLSKDGATYQSERPTSLLPMPATGSPSVPASVQGYIQSRGAMTALPDGKYLLRIDLTSTDTESNFADVMLGLAGYSVDSIPLMPRNVDCESHEALVCSIDAILPGQTVSLVFVLTATGVDDSEASIDVTVAADGLRKMKVSTGSPRVNRPALVTNFYAITRP